MNKTIQDLKMEMESIKKTQTVIVGIVEIENIGNQTGITDASITNRIQEMEVRIWGVVDTVEETDTLVKENVKSKKFLTQTSRKSGTLWKEW